MFGKLHVNTVRRRIATIIQNHIIGQKLELAGYTNQASSSPPIPDSALLSEPPCYGTGALILGT